MLLLGFHKDLLTDRYSSICLFMILCFLSNISVLSNYADDSTLFVIGKNREDIKSLLLLDFEKVNNWFYENFMILNPK